MIQNPQDAQRALNRRHRALAKTLLPCPKCGRPPAIDFGFLDAPYPPGHEFIHCPWIIDLPGVPTQTCGVHAEGAAAWNWRAK